MDRNNNITGVVDGYLIKLADGTFVWDILANGHPENPVFYTTKNIWEAKAWKRVHAAIKAAFRLREKGKECEIYGFHYDEQCERRIIGGKVEVKWEEDPD